MLDKKFTLMLRFPEIEEVSEYLANVNSGTERRVIERLRELQFLMSRLSSKQNQGLAKVYQTGRSPQLRWHCRLLECAYKFSGSFHNLESYFRLCVSLFGGEEKFFKVCEFALMIFMIQQAKRYRVPMTSSKDVLGLRSGALRVLRESKSQVQVKYLPSLQHLLPKGTISDCPVSLIFLSKVDLRRLDKLLTSVAAKGHWSRVKEKSSAPHIDSVALCAYPYLSRFLNLFLDNYRGNDPHNFITFARLRYSLTGVSK